WVLNLDNTAAGWQSAPDLPDARIQFGTAYMNGDLYAIGGQYRHDHSPVDLPVIHRFDVATGQWLQKANLPLPRSHFEPGTIVYDGNIIIVGGRANQNGYGFGQINNVTAYNPITDTWYELPQLPVKLIAPNAVVINNRLIVTTGGTNWNTGNKKTYISYITYTGCTPTTPTVVPPTATPTSEPPTQTAIPTATDDAGVTVTLTETPLASDIPIATDDVEFTVTPAETSVASDTPVATDTTELTAIPTQTEISVAATALP
ncbi:MAG: hypothetical protein H7X77_02570, partial [Anaerolineae bacterium]|nr:hypothetical protein [Anaerolineae bacterium]